MGRDLCSGCKETRGQVREAKKAIGNMTDAVKKAAKLNFKLTEGLTKSSKMIKTLLRDIERGQGAIQAVGPRAKQLKDDNQKLHMRLHMASQVMEDTLRSKL
jgi:hypothetical protein